RWPDFLDFDPSRRQQTIERHLELAFGDALGLGMLGEQQRRIARAWGWRDVPAFLIEAVHKGQEDALGTRLDSHAVYGARGGRWRVCRNEAALFPTHSDLPACRGIV